MIANSKDKDQGLCNSNAANGLAAASPGAFDFWKSIQQIMELQNQVPALKSFSTKENNAPMSFNQERLWLLAGLNPQTSAYNIPFVFRLHGNLNRSILENALQILVDRHEILRTTFTAKLAGQAIQKVRPRPEKILQCIDLFPDAVDRQSRVEEFIAAEIIAPFSLATEPLFRAKLLTLIDTTLPENRQNYILILNFHHIIFDGWSEGVLFQEISVIYAALCNCQDLSLAPLPIQYKDFSIWQRQCLQGDFLRVLKTYWQNVLGGNLQQLLLPVDYPPPSELVGGSATEKIHLSEELVSALKALARQERATLFQTLLAAFKVLLYHYIERSDICVCAPMANRNRNELKGLIGYFVNLLVLRTDLKGSPSFRQIIGRVKESASGASAYQDLPVQELVTCIEGDRAILSQVLFALQNTPQNQLILSRVEVERLEVDNGRADFDLFLSLIAEGRVIQGVLKYNTDLFQASTIALLLQRYVQILRSAIADPDTPIDALLLLDADERQSLERMRQIALGFRSVNTNQYVAPRNELEEKLAALWQDTLKITKIGIQDDFFELGGRSLAAVQLLTQVEQVFHRKISLSKIFQAPTIERMAALLRAKETLEKPITVVSFNTEGHKPPLFFIHSVEPSILHYLNVVNYLDRDRPFYGIQPPALSGDDSYLFETLEEMAAYYVNEIIDLEPNGPYYLVGHSMGGVIAYEIACQLEQQGHPIAFLGLLDTYAPGHQLREGITTKSSIPYQIYIHLFNLSKIRFGRKIGYIFERSKRIIPKFIWDNLNRSAFAICDTSENALPEIYENLPIYQQIKMSHYEAYDAYSPSSHYQGVLTLFRALERPANIPYETDLGWHSVTMGVIEIHEIPGHHNSMVHEPNVETLARLLQNLIDR
jgi:thioesterase domain-containing protein/acyl carrier protein